MTEVPVLLDTVDGPVVSPDVTKEAQDKQVVGDFGEVVTEVVADGQVPFLTAMDRIAV